MRFAMVSLLVFSIALMATPASAADSKDDKKKQAEAEKERQEIRRLSKDILARLYKAQPSAKAAIGTVAGYATFSNFGLKIFVAGSGEGEGAGGGNQREE